MAKKKRDEAEIRATADELPTEPPEEIVEIIKAKQKEAMLVYRAGWWRNPLTDQKEKSALVKCTACGEKYHLVHVPFSSGCSRGYGMKSDPFGFIDSADEKVKSSGDKCKCPSCGACVTAMHIGKISQTALIEKTFFMTFHNIRGHLVLLSWILFKECDKNADVSYTVRRYEGIAMVGGLPVRLTGYQKTMYYGISYKDGWEVRPRFIDIGDEWDEDNIMCFDKAAFELTDGAKSALDVFIREGRKKLRIFAYLQLWARYPQIENLVRSGLSPFVQKVIEDATYYTGYYVEKHTFKISDIQKHINVKKAKPHEMLGLRKEELMIANRYPLDTLAFYREILAEKKIRLTEEHLHALDEMTTREFRTLLKEQREAGFDPPIVRTINYIQKQRKAYGNTLISPSYLNDYWDMLREIQNGMPESLIYPKNLIRAHDLALLRQKEKVDPNINKKIEDYAASLDYLSFTDEEMGLFIRVCANQTELIKEGRFLDHCVGRYASDFSKKKTCILFIRKIENPDIPYYTLEYRDGIVIQNRGKKNCNRTPEIIAFEKEWLDHIEKIKEEKKSNGKYKRNSECVGAYAGA